MPPEKARFQCFGWSNGCRKRCCPVVALIVARLADAGGKRGFVFVHIPDDRADIAFVEEVVIVVGDFAAQTVFRIEADAGFEFVAFDLGYADFDGDAVALEAVEVGLYGRAGIMPVLFERLLEVEQQVEVVGRARLEARQAGDGLFGVTLCAGDFKVAEGDGAAAVHDDVQIGGGGIGVDGRPGVAELGKRVAFARYRAEDGSFAVFPTVLIEIAAYRLLPVFQRVAVVFGEVAV